MDEIGGVYGTCIRPYLRGCMENFNLNAYERGLLSQSQQLQGIVWRGRRDLNPRPPA